MRVSPKGKASCVRLGHMRGGHVLGPGHEGHWPDLFDWRDATPEPSARRAAAAYSFLQRGQRPVKGPASASSLPQGTRLTTPLQARRMPSQRTSTGSAAVRSSMGGGMAAGGASGMGAVSMLPGRDALLDLGVGGVVDARGDGDLVDLHARLGVRAQEAPRGRSAAMVAARQQVAHLLLDGLEVVGPEAAADELVELVADVLVGQRLSRPLDVLEQAPGMPNMRAASPTWWSRASSIWAPSGLTGERARLEARRRGRAACWAAWPSTCSLILVGSSSSSKW